MARNKRAAFVLECEGGGRIEVWRRHSKYGVRAIDHRSGEISVAIADESDLYAMAHWIEGEVPYASGLARSPDVSALEAAYRDECRENRRLVQDLAEARRALSEALRALSAAGRIIDQQRIRAGWLEDQIDGLRIDLARLFRRAE